VLLGLGWWALPASRLPASTTWTLAGQFAALVALLFLLSPLLWALYTGTRAGWWAGVEFLWQAGALRWLANSLLLLLLVRLSAWLWLLPAPQTYARTLAWPALAAVASLCLLYLPADWLHTTYPHLGGTVWLLALPLGTAVALLVQLFPTQRPALDAWGWALILTLQTFAAALPLAHSGSEQLWSIGVVRNVAVVPHAAAALPLALLISAISGVASWMIIRRI
jgi:hypothetical protein